MRAIAVFGAALFAVTPAATQTSLDWPEMVDLLAQQRTQAETCAGTLKSSTDAAAVATGRLTYGAAKSQADGVIAGLIVALVQGGEPDALPSALTSLKKAGAGLREVCDGALKTASAAGSRGLVEDILKAPIEPIVNAISSGVSALWTSMSKRTSSNRRPSKDNSKLRNSRSFEVVCC
jgi:hypothetical protein